MHERGICHRDLKPENILLKGTMQEVKICDFGSSKILDMENHMNTPFVVSRYYRAPELIMGSPMYSHSIDMFAVGCILFEMLTNTPLFPGETEGLQILEQMSVIGYPSESDMAELQTLIEKPILDIINPLNQITGISFLELMPLNGRNPSFKTSDFKEAADLLT